MMIRVDTEGKKSYSPDMTSDPLRVEKGYAHFRSEGQKDFLCRILGYETEKDRALFYTETFRGRKATVEISFAASNVFRLVMVPEISGKYRENAVFSFRKYTDFHVEYHGDFLEVSTGRLLLRFRTCPFEMTVFLDGTELTKEQIRDFNVDQKYKAVPIGFTVGEDGKVTDAFETFYMYSDEAFYGFGEKFTDFNRRGQKITVWQRDAQSTNSDVSYKGMPYFMSSMGYSVLLNTFTRTHFNMGGSSGVSCTMETEDPYLDYYMFCERDYKKLISDYTALSGRSPMIPRWAFGFWMSKMSYMSRKEVEDTVIRMEEFGMSADVIHIDGWLDTFGAHAGKELLAFDEERFPNPEEMIRWLKKRGIHLSLWMYPYVPSGSPQFESMKDRGFLVKNAAGEPYVFGLGEGDVAGQKVGALDFTNPVCAEYVGERVKRLARMGVGVIKTDFSEEIPGDAVFYDGSAGLQTHNRYPLLYARAIYGAMQEAKSEVGERALLWGRSGYAGSQNYPANWAGDSSAEKNNLAQILKGGLGMGISGVSFWGFDIGGFYNCDYEGKRVVPDDESYIRSVQMGLLSPLSRSHGQATPREPWVFSENTQKAFLKINRFRYRLLPYIYSIAFETHLSGIPMMRAMLLEFPDDLNVRNISSQYMFGPSLLAAPVFDQQVQHVYLPEGEWLDLRTQEYVRGGRWIAPEKRFDSIPLYLRENSILEIYKEAPRHIEEKNFTGYDLVMNLTDRIDADFYDDGIKGHLHTAVSDWKITVETEGMAFSRIRIYSPEMTVAEISSVLVNGRAAEFSAEGNLITVDN